MDLCQRHDHGVGFGLDISGAGQSGFLFYTGDVKNFTVNSIKGERSAISGAIGMKGAAGFITPEDAAGGRVIGLMGTYGPGVNPVTFYGFAIPFTFNINFGWTGIFNKK